MKKIIVIIALCVMCMSSKQRGCVLDEDGHIVEGKMVDPERLTELLDNDHKHTFILGYTCGVEASTFLRETFNEEYLTNQEFIASCAKMAWETYVKKMNKLIEESK